VHQCRAGYSRRACLATQLPRTHHP
jgi:hypothetical protein